MRPRGEIQAEALPTRPKGQTRAEALATKPKGKTRAQALATKPKGKTRAQALATKLKGQTQAEALPTKPKGETQAEALPTKPKGKRQAEPLQAIWLIDQAAHAVNIQAEPRVSSQSNSVAAPDRFAFRRSNRQGERFRNKSQARGYLDRSIEQRQVRSS